MPVGIPGGTLDLRVPLGASLRFATGGGGSAQQELEEVRHNPRDERVVSQRVISERVVSQR